jgi:flavin-dependent dehydrogenase
MRGIELFDVAIIGGGPAGAAAGATLARAGKKVVILEKERFPRFSVGESLLPHGNDLLKKLGVWDKIESAGFLKKYGAEFCTGDRSRLLRFWFGNSLGPEYDYSFQVERSKFDEILLQHARESGGDVRAETRVSGLSPSGRDLTALSWEKQNESGEIQARWVIDASGRSAFAGARIGLKRGATQKSRRIAIYGHFNGVFRNSGKAEGHITIVRISEGWFWIIPLAGGLTSVGLVIPAEKARAIKSEGMDSVFQQAVASVPEMEDRMREASAVGSLKTTGDYSWKFSQFAGPRILLTGDAAGFVDPIFSSGVLLALKSSLLASDLILGADKAERSLTWWERRAYTREVSGWMQHYSKIIQAFYDSAGFEVFMNPAPSFQIPGSIGRLVGGNAAPGFIDRLRLAAFFAICRFQRSLSIAPAIPSLH